MNQINGLIDPQKKAIVLQRIREGKMPFCAMKPEPERILKKPNRKPRTIRSKKRRMDDYELRLKLVDVCMAQGDNVKMAERLVVAGADAKDVTSDGFSLLMRAIERGNEKIAKLLLSRTEVNEDQISDGGTTALILAARHRMVEMVELLLKRGASPNRCNDRGQTALGFVYGLNDDKSRQIYKMLKKAGAKK